MALNRARSEEQEVCHGEGANIRVCRSLSGVKRTILAHWETPCSDLARIGGAAER